MKRIILIVLLLALVGSMAYAVVLTTSKSSVTKVEKKDKPVKKRSNCGSIY
jgi:Tfp pilus assembly protein PilO